MIPKTPKSHTLRFGPPTSTSPGGTILMEYASGTPPHPTEVMRSYYDLLAEGHIPPGLHADGFNPHSYSPHRSDLHQWRHMWRDYERHLLIDSKNNNTNNPRVQYMARNNNTPVDSPLANHQKPEPTSCPPTNLPKLSYTKVHTKRPITSATTVSSQRTDAESVPDVTAATLASRSVRYTVDILS